MAALHNRVTSLRKIENAVLQAVLALCLSFLALLVILPLGYLLLSSFTHPAFYQAEGISLWPRAFSLAAYRYLLSGKGFFNSLQASLFLISAGTPLHVLVSSGLAYMLSKKELPGRRFFLTAVLISMLFTAGLIPSFLVIRSLGLFNSWWAIILPGLTSAYVLFVLRTFLAGLPTELEDAARIDGCNELDIFFRVILPSSQAPLTALGLLAATQFWNTYFNAMVYLKDPVKWPLQLMLQQMVLQPDLSSLNQFLSQEAFVHLRSLGQLAPIETVRMAAVVLVILPLLLVYPFIQRFLAQGIMFATIRE